MKKKLLAAAMGIWAVYTGVLCAAEAVSDGAAAEITDSSASGALVQGVTAYQQEDWATALFFLRKAVSLPEGRTGDTVYLLIMSEMFSGDYVSAVDDCAVFLQEYPDHLYTPYVLYQQGRALHFIGKNQDAADVFTALCAAYPEHDLYSSALFWLAESFYSEYNYEPAKALYERIVSEFYDSPKALDAQYRLDSIDQREREYKLLYLLKVTSEEYLAAKEDYARQLRLYQSEELLSLRRQLNETEAQLAATERELESVRAEYSQSEIKIQTLEQRNSELQQAAQFALSAADTALEDAPASLEDSSGGAEESVAAAEQGGAADAPPEAATADSLQERTEVSALYELRARIAELRRLLDEQDVPEGENK